MKWMLVEHKPDVIIVSGKETYLGKNDAGITDVAAAVVFATREAAEAHRRGLLHPYHWVVTSAGG